MGLKQDIVIVNEYTIKSGDKGGSRGGTPGSYVERYMARTGATEDLTPVRLTDNDAYIKRYMARKDAVETLTSIRDIKEGMRQAQGLGGVAFGQFSESDDGDISMSDAKIKNISKQIQNEFDKGKTCLKTIISFDEEYLRRMGVIDEHFECESKGDYRGNIDQMKLRLSIMDGMKKLGKHFDDLMWTGVVQIDTKHVHCHLCMVDKGNGRIAKDGTQKGKLSAREMKILRRGLDDSLDSMSPIKIMSSNITHDRRNAKCFIKKYTHKTMSMSGTPQFLLACLPDNKNWWRASTNRKEMKKANAIVREYVNQVLAEPDSGYKESLKAIGEYADYRAKNENLSDKEYRNLISKGKNRLIDECVDSVYSVLKSIPDISKQVNTPLINAMSMDYYDMASELGSDPMLEFGFKLRSYSSRLSHHKSERDKYRNSRKTYEELVKSQNVSSDSLPLYEFYKVEEEYNSKLLSKYQHFLSFLPSDGEYVDEFNEVLDYRNKISNLQLLCNDTSIKRMSEDAAEDYGRDVYNMHGGHLVKNSMNILTNRLNKMMDTYDEMIDDFKVHLSNYGLTLEDGKAGLKVSTKKPYEFYEVKVLDLHHLGYDFPYDTPISKINVDEFVEIANIRYNSLMGAKKYLEHSGQVDFIDELPIKDVELMKDVADKLVIEPVLHSVKAQGSGKQRNVSTVRLDPIYTENIELAVKSTIQSSQLGDDS